METLRSRLRGAWASRSQNMGRAVRVWANASATGLPERRPLPVGSSPAAGRRTSRANRAAVSLQEDLLAGFEVAEHGGFVQADGLGYVGEGDGADAPLRA